MKQSQINYIFLSLSLVAIVIATYCLFKIQTTPTQNAFVDLVYLYKEFNYTKERSVVFNEKTRPLNLKLDTINMQLGYLMAQDTENDLEYTSFLVSYRDSLNTYAENLKAEYDTEIWSRINTYVQSFGKQNNYSMIFGGAGNGSIMYTDSTINITQDVLNYMNEKYEDK